MRIVAISDTHSRHQELKLPMGDLLLHAGDVTYKGSREETLSFLQWFGRQPHPHKIFIAGNHDFFLERISAKDLKELLPEGVVYLNDSCTTVGSIRIWGTPVTPYFYNWAFNRHRGPEIRKHWERIPAGTDLILTHGPAYGFLDLTADEQHVGDQDLLRKVLTLQPRYHIFGHIHESYGNILRSGIRFVNASVVNEHYRLVNRPIVIDW